MGRTVGTTDLHKTLGEPRWEGGSLNRAACEAGSPLPPQGPWDSRQGSPGGFSTCPVSLCSPAFFSLLPLRQISFSATVSPVELLSQDSSGPSELSRGVPRPRAHEKCSRVFVRVPSFVYLEPAGCWGLSKSTDGPFCPSASAGFHLQLHTHAF